MPPRVLYAILAVSLLNLPLAAMLDHQLALDGSTLKIVVCPDFVNLWSAGHLALGGKTALAYDPAAYNTLMLEWFKPATRFTNFSYPPSLLPFLMPFGALPYMWALLIWNLAGAAAFVFACLGAWPRRRDKLLVVALLLSPVVIGNWAFGQIGLFMAALFIGAFRVLPRRPLLAGVLIGLMTVKPQLGLFLPFALVALGAWRTIAAAAVTTLALAALSIVMFGLDPWQSYVTVTLPLQWSYVERMDDFFAVYMVSPYAAFWFLGFPTASALWAHWLVVAALSLVTLLTIRREETSWPRRVALIAVTSSLCAPYVLGHDLAMVAAALVWAALARDAAGKQVLPAMEAWYVAAVWALPFPVGFMYQASHVPIVQGVLVICCFWLAQHQFRPLNVEFLAAFRPGKRDVGALP